MTLQECYAKMNGDYENVKRRLMTDERITRFLLKFPADKSMEELEQAVAVNDIKASFTAAHTLKGVASNLAFSELAKKSSDLTEQLRNLQNNPNMTLFTAVKESYDKTLAAIKEFETSQH